MPLSITARPVRARGGGARGTECRLHVLGAGWQERHGGVPGSERGLANGVKEREGGKAGEQVSVCVCVRQTTWASCVFKEVCVFVCCSSVRTRVLVTMHAFVCMSMRMSTHS